MSKTRPFCVDVWRMVAGDCVIFTVVALGATCHHLHKSLQPQWAQWQAMASRPERGIKMAAAIARPDLVRVFEHRGALDLGSVMSCALECGDMDWYAFSVSFCQRRLNQRECEYSRSGLPTSGELWIDHVVTGLVTAARVRPDLFQQGWKSIEDHLSAEQAEKLMRAVAATNDWPLIRSTFPLQHKTRYLFLEAVAGHGNLQVCKQVYETVHEWTKQRVFLIHNLLNAMDACLRHDNVQVFPFVWKQLDDEIMNDKHIHGVNHHIPFHLFGNMVRNAAQHGRRDVIDTIAQDYQRFYSTNQLNAEFWSGVTQGAYEGHHVDLLHDYSRVWRFEPEWSDMLYGSIMGGHLDLVQQSLGGLVKHLAQHGKQLDCVSSYSHYLYAAASAGQKHIVDFLLEFNHQCDFDQLCAESYHVAYVALVNEHFDIVDRLLQHFHFDVCKLKGSLHRPTLQQLEYLRDL